MAARDAQLFNRIFQAITRFYRNPRANYVIIDGRYFAKKPTLRLIRFMLPRYRSYIDDTTLLERLYESQATDINIRHLLITPEPILSESTHNEFEAIKNLPIAEQDKAQNSWVQKIENSPSTTRAAPETVKTSVPITSPATPIILPTLPSSIRVPNILQDLASKTQIFVKKTVSKLTPMQIASLFTGAVGSVMGYGIAGTTGALAGASAAFLPSVISRGGGEVILKTSFQGVNVGANAVSSITSLTGNVVNVFPARAFKYIVFAIIGGILLAAMLGSGGLGGGIGLPNTGGETTTSKGFIGVNMHYLVNKEPDKIKRILSYLSNSCGVSVVRLWGTGSAQELKATLDLGTQYNVKFIIALADYPYEISGKYSDWFGTAHKLTYIQHVADTVTFLKDHPAIYAWELANEPHCEGDTNCVESYNRWVSDISASIKRIDPNHLISIGTKANDSVSLGDNPEDFSSNGVFVAAQYERNNSIPTISALTGHYYNGNIQGGLEPNEFNKEKALMLKELSIAQKLNKPFYIGEAGFVCEVPENSNCIQASAENEAKRAQQLKNELTEFFSKGATGYLVWQYSDRKTDNIENDMFSFFEGDPICKVIKDFSESLKPTLSAPTINSCQFTRSGVSVPIKSAALNKLITDVANTHGVPAPILASIAMHESASFIANADDDHDSIRTNNYCQAGPIFCEKNGQRLHEEDKPCTAAEIADGARTAKAIGLMQIIDIFNPGKNLCSLTESLNIAAEKLKVNGITKNPTKEQVTTAIKSYYNSCTYGSFNYCEEVWQDLQNCKQIFNQPTGCPVIGTITNPFGHNIANYPYTNEGCELLKSCHNGIDIATTPSTPVRSTLAGIITDKGTTQFKGNYIKITNSTGFSVVYEHLQTIPTSEIGETVEKGAAIGLAGSTGEGSTGTHVHYRVEKDNQLVNPLLYINNIQNTHPSLLNSFDLLSLNNYSESNIGSVTNFGVCNALP